MATAVRSVCNRVYNALPKNQYVQVVQRYNAQIQTLQQRILAGTNDKEFLHAVVNTRKQLVVKKEEIQQRLDLLNGKYYKDPESLLDKACKAARADSAQEPVHVGLLKERNQLQGHLKQVADALSCPDEPSHLHLRLKNVEIDKELRALRGKNYGDKTGQLHKAWRAYQKGQGSFRDYKKLDERRESLEASRFRNLQLLDKSPQVSQIEQIVRDGLQLEIEQLTEHRDEAQARIGVNKTKLACQVVGVLGVTLASEIGREIYQIATYNCMDHHPASICFPS